MPKISIILTSYNHAKYLSEAINSALAQTFTDFELIIWDDASTDESWEIIQSYKDPRIKAFRNDENRRGVYGINKAIAEVAAGQYIAIHHSDDVWEPTKLERQVEFLNNHPAVGAVFTHVLAIGEDGEPLKDTAHFYFSIFDQPNRTRHEWLNHFFYRGNALCHPSVLIRKECYQNCGAYRYGMAQLADFDMWIRLCVKYDIHVLREKLVRFRVRDNEANTSGNRPETHIRGAIEYYALLKNFLQLDTLCEMEAVFPEAVKYDRSGGRFDPRFVLAMIAFKGHPFPWGRLFGAELLLDLFRDPKSAIETRSLYGFDYRDFIAETGKCDVFSLEQVGNLSATVARREAQIAAHDQAVEERNVRIKVLQEEVAKLGAWGQAQEKILRERDKQIAHFNQTVASLKLVIAEREGRAEALQKEVDELIHLKQTQREEILERDARIASLTHAAAELEGKLSEVNKVLAERDANVASLTHATAELDGKIAGLNKVLAQRDAKVASLTVATVELDRVLAEREAKIAALVLSVAERSQELGAAQTELNSIYASRKWKLIMKVAVPVFFLKAVYGKMRALIRSTCNTFHRLAGHVPPTGLPVVRQPANDKAACDLRHPGTRGSE